MLTIREILNTPSGIEVRNENQKIIMDKFMKELEKDYFVYDGFQYGKGTPS